MNKTNWPKHFIRVAASSEASYTLQATDFFEAVVIGQPFLLNNKISLRAFLEKSSKPFIIDPETYRYFFERKYHYKTKKGKKVIRAWHNKMAQLLPAEIKQSFGQRRAKVENLIGQQMVDLCKAIIEAQTCLGPLLLPVALVCPYALIEEDEFNRKINFNLNAAKTMAEINSSNLPVMSVVYIDKEVLASAKRIEAIISSFGHSNCDAVAIWVDDFDETKISIKLLTSLLHLYSELAKTKVVISLYGGLAQILMMYDGLTAVAHGIHYQMSKKGTAEGGGPAHYFYLPNLRQRIRTIEASSIIQRQELSEREYLQKICSCPVCKDEISKNQSESILDLEGNKKSQVSKLTVHFSYNKMIEINNVLSKPKEKYIDWLRTSVELLKLNQDETSYKQILEKWIKLI